MVIQALDLARENAALRDELTKLRQDLEWIESLVRDELPCAVGVQPLDAIGSMGGSDLRAVLEMVKLQCVRSIQRPGGAAGLVLVMPRRRAAEYEWFARRFANVADCEVVLDRRVSERRRTSGPCPAADRRRLDRRNGNGDKPDVLVLSV